jgi:plastocyanin domain-containing protein
MSKDSTLIKASFLIRSNFQKQQPESCLNNINSPKFWVLMDSRQLEEVVDQAVEDYPEIVNKVTIRVLQCPIRKSS